MLLSTMANWLAARGDRVWSYTPGSRATTTFTVLEALLAAVVVISCLPLFWQFMTAMSHASLWQDELATVMLFSSKGAWTTVTTYTSGSNNHIFFNLVNALTPKADPYDPFAARIWSFVAVVALFGLTAIYFARRKLYLEVGVLWALLSTNYHLLDLLLQARGYGFAALAATVSCIAVVAYTRGAGFGAMLAIGLATLLGTYSVPTYAAFGLPLIAALLVFSRDLRWIPVGIATTLAIVGVYLPVAEQMAATSTSWAGKWGTPYASLDAVAATFKAYLFPFQSNGGFFAAASALLVCAMALPTQATGVTAVRVFISSSLALLAACLWLQTPTVRTTSFIVIPVAFACVLSGSIVLRARWGGLLVPLVGIFLVVLLSGRAIELAKGFQYLPYDNWKGAAELIQAQAKPGTAIWVNQRAPNLRAYLPPEYPFVAKFDAALFASGNLVVVDFALQESDRFDPAKLPAGVETLEVKQRRNDRILVYRMPQADSVEGAPR